MAGPAARPTQLRLTLTGNSATTVECPLLAVKTDIDGPAAYDFHLIDLDQRQSMNLPSTCSEHASLGEFL